jgi:hypothetical protein
LKISRNTPDQLILDKQPWFIALLLGFIVLAFVGGGLGLMVSGDPLQGFVLIVSTTLILSLFFWAFVRRNQLILDRHSGTLTHRRRTLLGYRKTVHELHHLDRAMVETSSGDDSDTYRMSYVLLGGMDEGTHPFTAAYSSDAGARRAAKAVNDWLAANPSQ